MVGFSKNMITFFRKQSKRKMKTANPAESINKWLNSGRYLPKPLRDFHGAKEIFRAIDEIVERYPEDLVKRPDWVACHCYVIDVFLWFMAQRGWTLQRTRCNLEFRDLDTDVKACTAARSAKYMRDLNSN